MLLTAEQRACLASDQSLGAGNFLAYALAANPSADETVLWLEKSFTTYRGETFSSLTLRDLDRVAREYAAWFYGQGVRAKDPVAVFLDDGVEYLIHYLALVSLGAIPALINGNMEPEHARGHVRRIGAVGVVTDANHRATLAEFPELLTGEPVTRLPDLYPHQHSELDPIMIAHSSGTTGAPKPVLLQHKAFFHGVRYRLGLPPVPGGERILSSLPHSHNCAIAYIMLALLAGTPVYIASDHTGRGVLRQIATFQPTMVVSFPQTYVEMCEEDLEGHDLSSVKLFFNGGDAAHEAHIRKLVQFGARFIDGMGSSEMGFSLFRHVHAAGTSVFGRCVGTPLEWVDAQVLSDDGVALAPGVVGRLGVKAPSVTTGYWNDSLMTYKAQLAGYWLTGDLAYRDEAGRFYHVDRVPDVVRTAKGPLYSLQTEELLMQRFPTIHDCSVVAVPYHDGSQGALALVRMRPGTPGGAESWLASFNEALAISGKTLLAAVELVQDEGIPLGATGKVLKRRLREKYAGYFAEVRA